MMHPVNTLDNKPVNNLQYRCMARYNGLRKTERNDNLRRYAKEHPELSYKELGQAFGISRSRAWRIINGKSKERR